MSEPVNRKYLAFEMDVRPLDEKLALLERGSSEWKAAQADLEKFLDKQTKALSPWERMQLARHPDRPYARDFIEQQISEFEELAGDRLFGEDPAIIAGIGRLDGRRVVVLAQQKGRTAEQRAFRNFGMARPEGYRKAQRLMDLAVRFSLPIVALVDTPGAYPGLEAEERGQAQAIAETLVKLLEVPVPTVCLVLGEGGSGGALALAVTDRVLMAEHAIYSVISPEGCAAILWKSSDQAPEAARALRGDAGSLLEFGLIDEIVPEPAGGAHRDLPVFLASARKVLITALGELSKLSTEELLRKRQERYRKMTAAAVREEEVRP